MMFWQLSDSTTEKPIALCAGKPSASMIAFDRSWMCDTTNCTSSVFAIGVISRKKLESPLRERGAGRVNSISDSAWRKKPERAQ